MKTQVQKNGNIHLPIDVQRHMSWNGGDKLLVVKTDKESDEITLKRIDFKNT